MGKPTPEDKAAMRAAALQMALEGKVKEAKNLKAIADAIDEDNQKDSSTKD